MPLGIGVAPPILHVLIVVLLVHATTIAVAVGSAVSSSSSRRWLLENDTVLPTLPTMMTAVRKKGRSCQTPFDCVVAETVPIPSPGFGHMLLQVAASSVNPCDVDFVELGVACAGGGGTLGMDVAGTVISVKPGLGCARFKPGDKVWADTGGVTGDTGGMAEYAVVKCSQAGLAPQSISLVAAGTIPLVGFTSLECLTKTGAPWNQQNLTLVVTSGTGGTGFIAIQLAKALGATRVVTATSGQANIELAKRLGADVVYDYKVGDIFAPAAAGGLPDDSVDVVFDNFGAKGTADKAMRTIRPGGTILVLPGGNGGTTSRHPKAGVRQMSGGMASATNHTLLDTLASLFDNGQLKPEIFAEYSLHEAAKAFALSKTGTVVGKVAVVAHNDTGVAAA